MAELDLTQMREDIDEEIERATAADQASSKKISNLEHEVSSNTESINDLENRDVLVFGDSWSDTVSATSYTKWPVTFAERVNCRMHIYARNGSTITGETPVFSENGNVKGQIQNAASDNSFNHDNATLCILMGGINDYRSAVSSSNIVTGFITRINEIKSEFPNARIVCFVNNQIFVTSELWNYTQAIIRGIKGYRGIPAFHMIGWCHPSDYIDDRIHPNNSGHRNICANVIACCLGGVPTFYNTFNKYPITIDGSIYNLYIQELITENAIEQAIQLNVPSGTTTAKAATLTLDASDKRSLTAMSFTAFMWNWGRVTPASLQNMTPSYYQSDEGSTTANKMCNSHTVKITGGIYDGNYLGRSSNVKMCYENPVS